MIKCFIQTNHKIADVVDIVDGKRVIKKQKYQGKQVLTVNELPPTESIDMIQTQQTDLEHKQTLKSIIESTPERRRQSEQRQEQHDRNR